MYKIITLTLTISVLSACNTPASNDPTSAYFEIPLSTKITLLKSVTIAANSAHINFQGGEIKSIKSINQYQPFCRFEVNRLSESSQQVKANTYQSVRIRSDYNVVSMPDVRLYYTEFILSSDKDKNVRSLNCGQWSTATDASTYLSIKQMQDSVGGYMRIQLPKTTTSH